MSAFNNRLKLLYVTTLLQFDYNSFKLFTFVFNFDIILVYQDYSGKKRH